MQNTNGLQVKVYELFTEEKQQLEYPELVAIGDGHFAPILGMAWAPDEKQVRCAPNYFRDLCHARPPKNTETVRVSI